MSTHTQATCLVHSRLGGGLDTGERAGQFSILGSGRG
jgi:hypothetical protein